jgi:hypothetical protein
VAPIPEIGVDGVDHLPFVVAPVPMKEALNHLGDAVVTGVRTVEDVVINGIVREEPREACPIARLDGGAEFVE